MKAAGKHATPIAGQPKVSSVGPFLFVLNTAGTVLTVVGACAAYAENAPIWALWLPVGYLLNSITVGGVIGYLFHTPRSGRTARGPR